MYTVIIPSANMQNLAACMAHLKERRVVVINEMPFCFARAINAGIRAAARDDVILLNDDALLINPDGFAQMQNLSLDHPEFGIISARIQGDVCNPEQREDRGDYWEAARPMVAFIAAYIPRATIDRTGELDERFSGYGYEDDDYCRRVRQAGLKIAICGRCLVEHHSLPSTFRSGKFVQPADFTERMEHDAKLFQEKWGYRVR